jgi:ClpP class serine protease
MRKLQHVIDAVFNQPWAIQPEMLDIIAGIIEAELSEDIALGKKPSRESAPQLTMMRGLPVIPIQGVISRRMNWFSEVSGGTSIETLDAQFTEAMATDAPAIILSIDSPGGGVQGISEFASRVHDAAMNSSKLILSHAELAASAAYWIGSQANEVYVTQSGTLGSIGIVARVTDTTRMDKNSGIDSTIIRSSELKAPGQDGLTPNQMNSIKARVSELYSMFKEQVQAGRPGINIDSVSTGETWIGSKAVAMGLADEVMTLDAVAKRYGSKTD